MRDRLIWPAGGLTRGGGGLVTPGGGLTRQTFGFSGKFPTTAAQWASKYPAIATPTAIHGMQEAAAPLSDTVGTAHLDTEVVTPIYQQPADEGRVAFELDALGEGITCTTSGELDAAGSFSFWTRVKVVDNGASLRGIAGKRESGGLLPGWYTGVLATTGRAFVIVDTGASSVTVQIVGDFADGTWQDWLVVRDTVGGNVHIYVDAATASGADPGGSSANTALYSIGTISGVATCHAGCAWSYGAFWDGVAITSAEWATLRAG